MAPIAVTLAYKATPDQYRDVIQRMGLTPNGPTPPGALFHWAALDGDTLRVTDVWESREAFDAYFKAQIEPQSKAAGMSELSEQPRFYDVLNYFISQPNAQTTDMPAGTRASTTTSQKAAN